MRYVNAVLIVLVLTASLTGCPTLNPFHRADVPEVPTDITEPAPAAPEQAAQKWLVWGIPALGLLALIALGVGLYLKNNLAMIGAGVLGAGLLIDIALLTYWNVIAVVILIIILAAVAVGLLVAALWVAKKLNLKSSLLTSLQKGVDNAKSLLPPEPASILKTSLAAVQSLDGTQKAMDISRGIDPAERAKEAAAPKRATAPAAVVAPVPPNPIV